ncbi:HAD family hydrolase [Lysinibacillus piscis]|uniref:Sucrose phosphatase-like domain-containing protein n=1 Tax=Lysinibacillus piscis TaxID=2518931 RepID=A0ABQ5NPN3_9BACI|nr:HAD family hydrolase [Lysinibacillus sp. KH24]GLC90283.1 hypothetical protein LYSBPC_34100 [Lysinibacillus sp. KH24]
MLLFTSDLDRTLIYSNRMFHRYPPATNTIVVEYKEQAPLSMMTEATIPLLQQVRQCTQFVPVTTRARHLYERIGLMKELQPTFAITSNGGTILIDGQPDATWEKLLRQRIEDSAISHAAMEKQFQAFQSSRWLQRSEYVDYLFAVHYIDREALQLDELQTITQQLAEQGWYVLLHGRKLYIMPHVLTKEAAVTYLKEQFGTYNLHVAAGDSILDYGMMAIADIAYTPHHGDVQEMQQCSLPHTTYSRKSGEAFTKELLEAVLQLATK